MTSGRSTPMELHTPASLADVLERDYFPIPDGAKLYLNEYEWRMVIAALRASSIPGEESVVGELELIAYAHEREHEIRCDGKGNQFDADLIGLLADRLDKRLRASSVPGGARVASEVATELEYLRDVHKAAKRCLAVSNGSHEMFSRLSALSNVERKLCRYNDEWYAVSPAAPEAAPINAEARQVAQMVRASGKSAFYSASSATVTPDETGWLIERNTGSGYLWLEGWSTYPGTRWTPDASKAMRFCREQDAVEVWKLPGISYDAKVTGHSWVLGLGAPADGKADAT